MANPVFESGGLVRLRSGGPIMTVDHTLNEGAILCCWFDDTKYSSAIFNALAIVSVSAAEINLAKNQSLSGLNGNTPTDKC